NNRNRSKILLVLHSNRYLPHSPLFITDKVWLMIVVSSRIIIMSKANSELSNTEKETKKKLKSELKYQRRVQKLETRIKHAISRKDPIVEQAARVELAQLLRNRDCDSDGLYQQQMIQQEQVVHDEKYENATQLVRDIFHQLLSTWDEKEGQTVCNKTEQNRRARDLLSHMTKGTQSHTMFKDITALRGYTRQKFYSRAILIAETFGKLSTPHQSSSLSLSQRDVMDACWKNMSNISSICSVGCGPGCDAVGLLAFLRGYIHYDEIKSSLPMQFILLDYAIKDWKDAVLNDLTSILSNSFESEIVCEHCDVTVPLQEQHQHIWPLLETIDIFLISYLLTETRDKWDEYLAQLVEKAKQGAIFYFAEPLPWQLHRLIRMSTAADLELSPLKRLRFAWVDSSMNHPEMQELDGRAGGPALLLAIKL
ncbi:hypothetical protein ACHAWC_001718, partial [Mediolabrus comicus]